MSDPNRIEALEAIIVTSTTNFKRGSRLLHTLSTWVTERMRKKNSTGSKENPMPKFSFCETVFAGSNSKWHIRPLTTVGKKLGGGADTPSLCGRVVSWDLNVELTPFHLEANTCKECLAEYDKQEVA